MTAFSNCVSWLQSASIPSRASSHARLRISSAHHEWNHDVQVLVAMDKGYFKEEGLEDVELIVFPDDEAAQLEALANGFLDVAIDPLIHRVLAAQDQGADIYIVGPRRKMHSFVIFGQKWMKSIEDLRGRTLHVGNEGEVTQQLRRILILAGMEYGKDVKIARRPNKNMHDLEGFRQSFIREETLTVNVHPWETEEWSRKGYPVLADTTKLFAPRQDRVVGATGSLVNGRADTLKAFLKSYIKASRFIVNRENSEEIKGILERAGFLTDEVDRRNFPKVMEGQWHRLSPDGSFPLEGVEQVIKEQKEAGNISAKVELEKVVRLAPLYQAQKELGIEPNRN